MTNYQEVLDAIYANILKEKDKGEVASYIPELAKAELEKFGIHLKVVNDQEYNIGAADECFSIQSISKVFTLAKAMSIEGHNVWERVDVEPSGNPFNHLSLLEHEDGIPRNPLINSGAIVIADILVTHLKNPKKDFLDFVRLLADDKSINYDSAVAKSERETGFKNFAAANLLKSYGNLHNSVDEVLDFYFHQCSLSMSCAQLSKAFYLFANKGKCMRQRSRLNQNHIKRINAIMLTCGFYDEAGEFAFEVGLPGKSGVGGGIVALLPNKFVITVWSPGLNNNGNSKLGMQALEKFTTKTALSIF